MSVIKGFCLTNKTLKKKEKAEFTFSLFYAASLYLTGVFASLYNPQQSLCGPCSKEFSYIKSLMSCKLEIYPSDMNYDSDIKET